MKKRLKINGVIVIFAAVLFAIFPLFFLRVEKNKAIDLFIEILGISLMLLGQILRVSARGYKSEHSNDGYVLVEGGPYALTRNPMYLGILLIGVGIILLLFQWWVFFIFLLFFIFRYIQLIFKEEKKLVAFFSQEYEDYRLRVPRIFPRWGVLLEKGISEYLPLRFSWIKKEIWTILWVLLISFVIESWEDVSRNGLRIYFRETIVFFFTLAIFICLIFYLNKKTNVSDKSKNNPK